MATATANSMMLDANVLMDANLAASPFNSIAVSSINSNDTCGFDLCASRLICREYLAGMSRPGHLTGSIPMASLIADVVTFESQYRVVEDGPLVTAELLALLGKVVCGGKQVHDANIVATMLWHTASRTCSPTT